MINATMTAGAVSQGMNLIHDELRRDRASQHDVEEMMGREIPDSWNLT